MLYRLWDWREADWLYLCEERYIASQYIPSHTQSHLPKKREEDVVMPYARTMADMHALFNIPILVLSAKKI